MPRNDGMSFEQEVLARIELYRKLGVAEIFRWPVEYKIVGMDPVTHKALAVRVAGTKADFFGHRRSNGGGLGLSIYIEAKSTRTPRLSLGVKNRKGKSGSGVTVEQLEFIIAASRDGATALVVWGWNGRVAAVPGWYAENVVSGKVRDKCIKSLNQLDFERWQVQAFDFLNAGKWR